MGGHASFALGLALALPDERVVLFDSEGDVLMGMGALPTIAEKAPANFYHFMLDNGVYATTGGQPVPTPTSWPMTWSPRVAAPATTPSTTLRFRSQIEEIWRSRDRCSWRLRSIPRSQRAHQRRPVQRKTRNQPPSPHEGRARSATEKPGTTCRLTPR